MKVEQEDGAGRKVSLDEVLGGGGGARAADWYRYIAV